MTLIIISQVLSLARGMEASANRYRRRRLTPGIMEGSRDLCR
jgi:hypothetical protein